MNTDYTDFSMNSPFVLMIVIPSLTTRLFMMFLKVRTMKTKKMGKSFCQVKRNVYICTQIQKIVLTTNTDNDK